MDHGKAWQSGPIQSWSGGWKLADMPGQARQLVQSKLSGLLAVQARQASDLRSQIPIQIPNLRLPPCRSRSCTSLPPPRGRCWKAIQARRRRRRGSSATWRAASCGRARGWAPRGGTHSA